jgi:putative addiction module killer protein
MPVENINIRLYIAANKKSPFEEWVKRLKDRKARAKINVRIARVRLGNFGDHKSVGEGVYELRIDYGPGYRVYYGKFGKTVVLLLCGGDKDSQVDNIKRAKEYWRDYKVRVGDVSNDGNETEENI